MNINKLILIVSLAIPQINAMNVTQPIAQPVLAGTVNLATIGAQNLTKLAQASSPAAVNFGIYSFINKFNKPAFIVFGTEAAIMLTLSCRQDDPLACLSSFISLNSLQAATYIALENIVAGATYALGEEVAKKANALAQVNSSVEIAQTVLTTFAAAGIGFYAWTMEPSLNQSMLLSMCSAVILTSLTTASKQPALKEIQHKIMGSIGGASHIGKILGIATIAAGTAALAYPKVSSEAILGAVISATKKVVSPAALASAQNMIRANYTWIEGYRWSKNLFKDWSY